MTDRATALRAFRKDRTDGLPPPPPLDPHPLPPRVDVGSVAGPEGGPGVPGRSSTASRERQSDQQAGLCPTAVATAATTPALIDRLLRDPVAACRAMSAHRENSPARPLNVDLTPDLARGFDDKCRELRIKKKDVVELLLRGWLTHLGHHDLDPELGPDPR